MSLIATSLGVAVDWSQVGRFPIVATARSGGPSSPRGLDYLVYLPSGYHRLIGRWPLILPLHGSGAVGRDFDRVKAGGIPRHLEAGAQLPFIVVVTQSPGPGWDVEALDALLVEVVQRHQVDPERVNLTGASMGGYGAWALAAAHPERFAAIAPICGGGNPESASRLGCFTGPRMPWFPPRSRG